MLAAIKEEIYRKSIDCRSLSPDLASAYASGVLTGMHRTLELMKLEEQSAGIEPDDSTERED